MKRTDTRLKVCITALILELLFIWGNSAMPAEISNALSQWVGNILSMFLPFEPGVDEGGHLLRKLAHFCEFACLGATLCWLAGMLGQVGLTHASLSLLGGITAACVDETIQVFTPGRSSSLIDVWIDTSGVVLGIGLVLLGCHLSKRKKKLKHRSKQL